MYARVSSDLQEEGGTIRSQLDAVLHHPALGGEAPEETYADDGISGYTKALWLRPEGARLMQDAESGRWKGYELVVYRLNRLGRRAREIEEAIDRLLDCGVTVYSVINGELATSEQSSGHDPTRAQGTSEGAGRYSLEDGRRSPIGFSVRRPGNRSSQPTSSVRGSGSVAVRAYATPLIRLPIKLTRLSRITT